MNSFLFLFPAGYLLTWVTHNLLTPYLTRHSLEFYLILFEVRSSHISINMLSALALLLAPALVAAHGAVTSYKIAGKEYAGYEVSRAM